MRRLVPARLVTVAGSLDPAEAGITDAHNHVWIDPVRGGVESGPVLNDREAIEAELIDYRLAGGRTIIDCQPYGCGRDGRMLSRLTAATGVNIVACTGYHLQRYYPPGFHLFQASADKAEDFFCEELRFRLKEAEDGPGAGRAGFLKVAFERRLEDSPMRLVEAAVGASVVTGASIEVHTEKGADAERITRTLLHLGLPSDRLVLCHMDKRPDFGLHAELAKEHVLLEYDTFYRSKYSPEMNLWPLIERMVSSGLGAQVAIATDMADAGMWARLGGGPGLIGILDTIIPRLEAAGCDDGTVRRLTGENIAMRLARPEEAESQ